MRSFIAIEIPDTLKSAMAELQQEFKKYGADVRWVKPENIHLTLKFLGSIDKGEVDKITEIMKEICSRYTAFGLEMTGVGVFPGTRSPRVLWVSINSSRILTEIQREIDEGIANLGFKQEKRKFTAHLTLGRFRSAAGKEDLMKAVKLHEKDIFGSVNVESISLMRSDLNPAGARYSKIAEFPLAQPGADIQDDMEFNENEMLNPE